MVVIVTVVTVVVRVTYFSKNNQLDISVMCSGQLFATLRCFELVLLSAHVKRFSVSCMQDFSYSCFKSVPAGQTKNYNRNLSCDGA